MASNFTSLWNMTFGCLASLLKLPLPIFLGSTQLCMMDIIIGTAGIFVAIASVRALLNSVFSFAGRELTEARNEVKSNKRMVKRDAYRKSDKYVVDTWNAYNKAGYNRNKGGH